MVTAGGVRPGKPEVLAPAGNAEALQAAIASGADSVYFGLTDYNARIRAQNFELGDLKDVILDLRRWGVRSCLTFNTLIFAEEERRARDVLEAIAAAAPDALIVQDLGVVGWVRELMPQVEVHASTQMTISSADGARLIQRLGVTRVVLARELTLPEIARLRSLTTMEIEVFVHGALCVSYSGQCLSSEAWGGRSANRGQCAQACRHPYDLIVDGRPHHLDDRAYLLSPRDLEGYRHVPELIEIGVAALKIEGRMKSAEYVAAATALYRAAVDRAWAAREAHAPARTAPEVERLAERSRQVFSRGESPGFLAGVNHQVLVDGQTRAHRGLLVGSIRSIRPTPRGPELVLAAAPRDGGRALELHAGDGLVFGTDAREEHEIGGSVQSTVRGPAAGEWTVQLARELSASVGRLTVGMEVHRNADPHLLAELREWAKAPQSMRQVPLSLSVRARVGEPLEVEARDPEGRVVKARSEGLGSEADRQALSADRLREQLGRLGGTRYRLAGLDLDSEGAVFVPMSELNRVRRDLVLALEERRGRFEPRAHLLSEHVPGALESDEAPSPVSWAVARAGGEEEAAARASQTAEASNADASVAAGSDLFVDRVAMLCRTREQAEAAVGAGVKRVVLDFLDLVGLKQAAQEARTAGAIVSLALPRVQKQGEEKIESFFLGLGPEELLVRNLGSLERLRRLARENSRPMPRLVGDVSLNAVNPAAVRVLANLGLARVTPGLDLNGEQILDLLDDVRPAGIELPLHHRLPVFHTEHCVFAAFLSDGADFRTCGRPCDRHRLELEDRRGERHPVVADVGCRNTVFSAAAQSGLPYLARFRQLAVGSYRLELIDENAAATLKVAQIYRQVWEGEVGAGEALRELRAEGRYGVSVGSPEPPRRPPSMKPVGGKKPRLNRGRAAPAPLPRGPGSGRARGGA